MMKLSSLRMLVFFLFLHGLQCCLICNHKTAIIRTSIQERYHQPYGYDAKFDKPLANVMKQSIWWYKNNLSPILPSTCRFLPTCSSYGLESIEKYGPWKGGILTAWRIFRCNPTGGRGYDPPIWPPPNYFAGR